MQIPTWWLLTLYGFLRDYYFCGILTCGISAVVTVVTLYTYHIPIKWTINPFYFLFAIVIITWITTYLYARYCRAGEAKLTKYWYEKLDKKYVALPECCICMERPQSVVFNCGHSGICHECVNGMVKCHLCRKIVTKFTYCVYDNVTYHPEFDVNLPKISDMTYNVYNV
jgi:energy-coupling factor transporter transmembrane protein EcfT